MNKLKVRLTLDKLPDIHADLVRIDLDLQEWTFLQLVATLKKCTTRNQKIISNPEKDFKKMIKIKGSLIVFIVTIWTKIH